jgi:hypothetical protein
MERQNSCRKYPNYFYDELAGGRHHWVPEPEAALVLRSRCIIRGKFKVQSLKFKVGFVGGYEANFEH